MGDVFAGPIVTLADAKEQIDVAHALRDAFIQSKVDDATAIVGAFLNFNLPAEPWTATTVPRNVRAAILNVLADQWANRGTDDNPEPQKGGALSYRVQTLLAPWHIGTAR
jgi:hypothetical protein